MLEKKKIAIITRHYPPNKNINGILACEMAFYLEKKHDCSVTIICMDTKANGNKESVEPVGEIIKFKPYFKGENKFSKLFAIINEGYRLAKKAKKIESDLIICTTSPPLLPFWASKLFKKKNKWALWSLDLFPEIFIANKQLKEKSFLYKYLYRNTYKKSPNFLIALGKEQAKCIEEKYNSKIQTLILPAGVLLDKEQDKSTQKPNWHTPSTITLGYFGNIGYNHNPSFIESCIEACEKHNFKFILACYGEHAQRVIKFAKNYSCVELITEGLPQEHLKYIDIHLVSLVPSSTHSAVPSKAVTAITCGRPILFCGDESSDNWQMFHETGWFIKDNQNIKNQIENLFERLSSNDIEERAKLTNKKYSSLKNQVINTYKSIATLC